MTMEEKMDDNDETTEINRLWFIDVAETSFREFFGFAHFGNLLISGATGSGKSNYLRCFLNALSSSSDPSHVRFLIFDLKTVDFHFFGKSPFLLAPIVKNPVQIDGAIALLEEESKKRIKAFQEKTGESFPEIAVVADEWAALFHQSAKSGIYFFLASQLASTFPRMMIEEAASLACFRSQPVDSLWALKPDEANYLQKPGNFLFRNQEVGKMALACPLAGSETVLGKSHAGTSGYLRPTFRRWKLKRWQEAFVEKRVPDVGTHPERYGWEYWECPDSELVGMTAKIVSFLSRLSPEGRLVPEEDAVTFTYHRHKEKIGIEFIQDEAMVCIYFVSFLKRDGLPICQLFVPVYDDRVSRVLSRKRIPLPETEEAVLTYLNEASIYI
jgi:hypothetical protein